MCKGGVKRAKRRQEGWVGGVLKRAEANDLIK